MRFLLIPLVEYHDSHSADDLPLTIIRTDLTES